MEEKEEKENAPAIIDYCYNNFILICLCHSVRGQMTTNSFLFAMLTQYVIILVLWFLFLELNKNSDLTWHLNKC